MPDISLHGFFRVGRTVFDAVVKGYETLGVVESFPRFVDDTNLIDNFGFPRRQEVDPKADEACSAQLVKERHNLLWTLCDGRLTVGLRRCNDNSRQIGVLYLSKEFLKAWVFAGTSRQQFQGRMKDGIENLFDFVVRCA